MKIKLLHSAYTMLVFATLVTECEWDYVVSKKDYRSKIFQAKKTYTLPKDTEEASVKNETYTHMMHMDAQHGSKATDVNPASKQSTTDDTRANISAEKLVGGKDMIEDLNEWVMRGDMDQGNRNKAGINGNISYSSLVVGKPLRSGSETKNFRYPWEAFPDVGFRCALSL